MMGDPDTQVTHPSRHATRMHLHAGGVDAVEGVFGDGRARALRPAGARWRANVSRTYTAKNWRARQDSNLRPQA